MPARTAWGRAGAGGLGRWRRRRAGAESKCGVLRLKRAMIDEASPEWEYFE